MSVVEILAKALLDDKLAWIEFLELAAVLGGLKKVARLTGTRARGQELQSLARALKLPFMQAPFHFVNIFSTELLDTFSHMAPGLPLGEDEGIFFIGHAIEPAILALRSGASPVEFAKIYGYPPCCAEVYHRRIQSGQALWLDVFRNGLSGVVHAPWQMNRFGRLFAPFLSALPDYFPCSVSCAPSRKIAKSFMRAIEVAGLGDLIPLVREHLCHSVLYFEHCLYWLKNKGRAYFVAGCLPLSENVTPLKGEIAIGTSHAPGICLAFPERYDPAAILFEFGDGDAHSI